MELEPDLGSQSTSSIQSQSSAILSSTARLAITATQDDIENELRDFLENGSGGLTSAGNVGIEQMLMD